MTEPDKRSSSGATAISGGSTIDAGLASFPDLRGEDPYIPNLWIYWVDFTDEQGLVMEHLVAHLNHPRVVSVEATANAIYGMLPLKTVPVTNVASDATTHQAAVMGELWCIFFEIAKNIPSWHPAQERLQNLIGKLVQLFEAGAEDEKKECMRQERDGLGTNVCFAPSSLPLPFLPFHPSLQDVSLLIANISFRISVRLPSHLVGTPSVLLGLSLPVCFA